MEEVTNVSENSVTKKMSAAAFFNENRAIAGFGNSMRAVFTSIRELVENGLDAAENRGINPNISIDLRKLSSREINELLDVKQYKKLEKHLDFLQLTCTDNGTGVPGHLIADLFGRVLTGTKYGVIQTRGRFGLGAKMCLLYSMSSVDLPAKIRSRYFMDDITHEMHLMINLEKNEPIIMEQREFLPGDEGYLEEAGTEISITFTGAWNLAKNSVREYFRQLAIITPYSYFQVKVPGDKEGEYEEFIFESVVDDMPPPPQVVKIHPYGCDITQFKSELSVNNDKKLKEFLANQFMGVTKEIAEDFFQLLEIDPNKHPNELTSKEIRRIVHEGFVKAHQEAKEVKRKRDRVFQFDPPKGTALSPLGAGRLKRGLEKELNPKFAEAISRPPKAYSGHPFVVEAALGYGGGVTEASQQRGANVQDNKIIYRYANRIPLIFGAGNDVISHVVSSIRWNEYGLTRQSDPLAVTVSIVSTKIPFPETSKEYISIVPEIEEEIRLALQQLGRRLKTFLGRAKRRRREHARLSRFVKSAPIIVENLSQIIEDEGIGMADFRFEKNRIASSLAHGSPKKAKLFMPLGQRLFGLNIWCSTSTQNILKNKNILSVSDFLITPTKDLMYILTLDEQSIYNIKLRTIFELDKEGLSPQFDSKIFVSRAVERRFDKNFVSLKDALNRRWIQNSYHYLATESVKLKTVSGLLEKLFENKKDELINQLLLQNRKNDGSKTSPKSEYGTDSLTAKGQLKIEHLFPPFKVFKKLSNEILAADLTVEEFIYQTQLPNGINYQQEITAIFIDYLKEVFIKMSKKFPTFNATNITKMTPDWTDGYTKNAFHRRKIRTIESFINTSTDDLVQVKEMERILYSTYLELLVKQSPSINLSAFEFIESKGLKNDEALVIKSLAAKGIKSLAQLLYFAAEEIQDKKLVDLAELLMKETKFTILSSLQISKKGHNSSHIKIIPSNVEKELHRNQIFNSSTFLSYSSLQLRKMGLKKREVDQIKKTLGTPLPKWLGQEEMLKECGVIVLEELFFNSAETYSLLAEKKKKYFELANVLRTPIIFSFPQLRRSSYLLKEVGINCLGRFLIWPDEELASILGYKIEEIKAMKDAVSLAEIEKNRKTFSKPLSQLNSLFPRLITYFGGTDETLQDLFYLYPSEKVSLSQGLWKKIDHLSKLSQLEIIELAQLFSKNSKKLDEAKEALLRLNVRNIITIRQFLDLIPEIIESELSAASHRKIILELYHMIKNRDIEETSDLNKQVLLISEYDEFERALSLPISRIGNLTLQEYEDLRTENIIAIHQLFEYSTKELKSILNKTEDGINHVFKDFKIEQKGTSFFIKGERSRLKSLISFEYEESERFSTHEIESLILAGYDSVDKIFFLSHPLTFSASLVHWNVIDKFRKLLRSPLTLVAWEKVVKKKVQDEETETINEIDEIQISTLSTDQLNTLRNSGISRIVDLLIVKKDILESILSISPKEAALMQRNLRISDTGTDLSELDIFKPHIVDILEEYNLVTIEDLYFSTSEREWTVSELPWRIIKSFKQVLNLPLKYISDMLDKELIEILKKVEITTLLGFMLISPENLMEKTGIPDERFENIKRGLALSDILGTFTLPSYYIPSLTFEQTEILRGNKIPTIADFILTSNQKLTKLLEIPSKDLTAIKNSLTAQTIQASYEDRGIFATETKLFDKLEQRQLSRDSIIQFERFQTIQEIYYVVEEEFYPSNPDLWSKVSAVKTVLDLPLRIFTEISEYSLEVWEHNNIKYVRQLLFLPDEEIKDPVLYRSISTYSSKMLEMRAFHYFAKLPSSVYNSSFFSNIVQDFEEKTLSDVVTDTKVISLLLSKDKQSLTDNYNLTLIRALLELPIRITPFFNRIKKIRREEYKNTKIGDVFDIDLVDHSALAPFYNKLQEVDSLNNMVADLAVPISSMGLPRELALKLSKSSINTLIDFFSTPVKTISEITGIPQRYIREIQDNLDYSLIQSFKKAQTHDIIASELITDKHIESLKKIGILDLESLYYSAEAQNISSVLPVENYAKVKEILSGSIRFIGFFASDEIKRLEFYNINSVIDLALLDKKELFHITQNPIYKEFHALDILSLDEVAEKRAETALSLELLPSIEEDYLEKIKQLGINSIQDFNSRMSELRDSHPHLVKLDVFRDVQLYLSSVAFLGLNNQQVQKLVYSGVGDILSFITEDVSTIAIILDTEETEVRKYLDKISSENLLEEIEKKGVKLTDFPVLSKSTVNYLLKSDKDLVQDVYSQYYQAFTIANVSDDVLRDFLNSCNVSIYRIKELSPETKIKLSQMGILRVIDFLCTNDSELKNALGGKIGKDINEVRRGNFTLIKGTELLLNEPILNILKDLYFEPSKKTVEDLFGFVPEHLLQFTETERIEKITNISFVEQLVSFLSLSTLSLTYFDVETKAVLWNIGIKHVIELISTNIQDLKDIPREVIRAIREFQRSFNLSVRMSETFSPYIEQKLSLPKEIRGKFKTYGLTTALFLFDFMHHPLFELTNKEKNLLSTATANLFKPVTWLVDHSDLKLEDLTIFRDKKANNIISALLILDDDKQSTDAKYFSEQFYSKFKEVVNENLFKIKPPEWSLKLADLNLIKDQKLLRKLKTAKILYLDELLSLDSSIIENHSVYEELRSMLLSLKNFSVASIDGLSVTNVKKLKQNGVRYVFQFLLMPVSYLSQFMNVSEEKIEEIKLNIDLEVLESNAKLVGLDIQLIGKLNDKIKRVLMEHGCVSLTQAAHLQINELPLTEEEMQSVRELVSILQTPITLIGKVLKMSRKNVDQLVDEKIFTYTDLLEIPQEKWPSSLKKLITNQQTDPTYLIKQLYGIQKFGMSVEELGLTKSVTTSMLQTGLSTVDHLLYVPDTYLTSKGKIKLTDLLELRDRLGRSVSILPNLTNETIEYCLSNNYQIIEDLLIYFKDHPKKIREEITPSLRAIKTISEVGFVKSLSETEQDLQKRGYYSYTSLLTSANFKTDKELFSKFAPYLLANLRFLDLESTEYNKLKRSGIFTISGLLVVSPKTIATQTKMSISKITTTIDSIIYEELKQKIDANIESVDREFFLLSNNDKDFLKSIGIYSISDLNEYSTYSWLISENKLKKIKGKIETILETSILYYPNITKLTISEIEKQYYDKGIFSIQELLSSVDETETEKIIVFLQEFASVDEQLDTEYITAAQLFSETELTTLSKSIPKKNIKQLNEFLSELYKNYEKISEPNKKILRTLKHPLSALSKLTTSDVKNLNKNNNFLIIDILVKSQTYWNDFSAKPTGFKVLTLLSTLTLSKIRSQIRKRPDISSLGVFDTETIKEISSYYQTIDEILYAIESEDYEVSRTLINKVQRTLTTPVKLIMVPKISLKVWKKLNSSNDTVTDLLKLSDKDLSSFLSIPQNDIPKIRSSFNVENMIREPSLKSNIIFSQQEIETLNNIGYKTYDQLVENLYSDKAIPKTIKPKMAFIQTFDIKKYEPKLDESLTILDLLFLINSTENLAITKKQKELIESTADFFFSRGTQLCTILNIDSSAKKSHCPEMSIEYLLLLKKYTTQLFDEIWRKLHDKIKPTIESLFSSLNRSPVILTKLTADSIHQISTTKYKKISELLLLSRKQLYEQISDKNVQRNVRNLSLGLFQELSQNLTSFPSSLLTPTEMNTLNRSNIKSIEEALVFLEQSKKGDSKVLIICNKISKVMETDLTILPSIIQDKRKSDEVTRLKLSNVYDLLTFCKTTQKAESRALCSDILYMLKFDKITQSVSDEQSRFSSFFRTTEYLQFLKRKKIKTFGPLVNHVKITSAQDLEQEFEQILSALRAPLSIFTLDQTLLKKLRDLNIHQVIDLILLTDINKQIKSNLTEKQQTVMQTITKQLNFISINQLLSSLYPVSKVSFIDENSRKQLIRTGYSTISHLNISNEILASSSKIRSSILAKINRILDSPVYYLTDMIRDNPGSVFALYDKGIFNLWGVYAYNTKDLAKIIKITDRQVKSYLSTLTDQSIKLAQKDQILVKETLPYLEASAVVSLQNSGFESLQEIMFPSEDKKKSPVLKLQQVSDLKKHLNKTIDEINVDTEVVKQIRQLGITTFREFAVYPSSTLDGKTNLSYIAIKRIKSKLPLKKIKTTKAKTATKLPTKKPAKKPATAKPVAKPIPKTTTMKPPATKIAPKKMPTKASTKQTTLLDLATRPGQKKTSSKTSKRSSTNSKGGDK